MVTLFLNATIDEYIANTNSTVEIYLNNCLIGCLDSGAQSIEYCTELASNENSIVVKRKYKKSEPSKERNVIKIVVSSLVSFFLVAGSIIEPFECPYECEETIVFFADDDLVRIDITGVQRENDLHPSFHIDSQNSSLKFKKSIFISKRELRDYYSERKRLVYVSCFSFTAFLAVVLFWSVIFNNLTTTAFLLLILGLVVLCTIYSLRNLNKEYQKHKHKSTRE